jgi:hypothetical protein
MADPDRWAALADQAARLDQTPGDHLEWAHARSDQELQWYLENEDSLRRIVTGSLLFRITVDGLLGGRVTRPPSSGPLQPLPDHVVGHSPRSTSWRGWGEAR